MVGLEVVFYFLGVGSLSSFLDLSEEFSSVWAASLDPFFSATSFGAVLSSLLLLSLSVDSSFLVAKLTTALNPMKSSF